MTLAEPKIFDLNDYLNRNVIRQQDETFLKTEKKNSEIENITFQSLWELVNKHFDSLYDSNQITKEEKENRHELEEAATVGKEKESKIIMTQIEEFLQEKNLLGVDYPTDCYGSLVEAVFHEIYRFGIFAKWSNFPHSVSAKIRGNKMLFKINNSFVEQPEKLRDGQVEGIIRRLQDRIPGLKINKSNPTAEFDMEDGTRIKVLIPPKVPLPTIVFRRFVVKNYSFDNQANLKTIPKSDVELWKILSRAHLNTIIAGQVESGKSTFLKTMYGARDSKFSSVLIENHPETYIWRDFPDRDCDEIYLNGDRSEIKKTIEDALRIDHHFFMFQEVRGEEAEGAISATEKGTSGLLMTYHITDPEDTPRQLAQHIVDAFPARTMVGEIKRIAKQLDIGITMTSLNDGSKRVTSLYEIYFDKKTEKSWINYIITWDKKTDTWKYNSDISQGLIDKIADFDESLAERFVQMINERAKLNQILGETKIPCI